MRGLYHGDNTSNKLDSMQLESGSPLFQHWTCPGVSGDSSVLAQVLLIERRQSSSQSSSSVMSDRALEGAFRGISHEPPPASSPNTISLIQSPVEMQMPSKVNEIIKA